MANINDVEKLYNALKRDGYDDLGTLDEFTSRVSDRDKAQKLYEAMQRDGYDDLGTADDFFGRLNPQPAYKPTADELAGFQNTVNQAQQAVAGSRQAAKRIDARQKHAQKTNYGLTPPQVKLGENSKVVETDPHFNLDTGKMESTYITEQGNEYGSRAGADIEQNAVDIAKHMQTLPGQLQDAYAERERLQAEIEAETQRIGYGQSPERSFAPQVPGSIPRQSAERLSNDRLQTLYAAQRQNEERITALEAERDDDGGTQFWRGFVDAAKNPSTWTFGITDLQNMTQLMRIKDKVDGGEQLTDDEETLLKNTMANGYAQQMFGENRGFMYRAGGISMQALPFVAEFVATGGFSSLTQMGASAGEKVAEKFALEGLKKTILRNTGVVMGDIASSFIMANTTGAARTGADIMQRHTGQVTMDEEGNYKFDGGKGIGQSIYEGEVASTLEYYTEKLGEHLQLGNWIAKGADKMGLSKLSKAIGYLSNSKMLNAGGIQDYPSEVVEEQANLLLNAILVGDNNFSIDPNSKDFDKSVFNPKTQLDIWGGMLFSIGLMQAPRLAHTGYNAAGYYAYKHTTDVADANAAIVFGADNWQMIKEQIDNCDNEHFSELMQSVLDGGMNDMQKTATLNYAGNLLKMRGYNNGMMADVRGGEDFQSEEGFLSHGIDQGYQQGHEAQEPDEKKVIVDEANAAEQELSHMFSDQDMQWITNTDPMTAINVMLSNRGTNPGEWNDDEISAVVDYYQKQARAQGVMDAAADDVEYQVAKANAEVDANTHKELNQMIMAESGGEQFYIVGGDVSLIDDVEQGKYTFDQENTGDALIVRNADTGDISVKSPQMLSVTLVNDPNQLKMVNETQLRQQLTQQHEDDITFGSPAQEVFQLEDTVTLNDGQGNIIEGEIGQMPNAYDGAYVVYTSDGRAMQFTADDLNRMIVAHNGMEVQRSTMQPPVVQPEEADNAGGEAGAESGTGANEPSATASEPQQEPEPQQPQSALDRIPVLQDESGRPILNRKGKKQYQWHKATVEDTAEALTETTGGDMVLARDTATDLINNARGKLEKIRKQKPKGDDPIEIAESRAEIRRQEQEQQAIIKHWQDVNQTIQRKMQEESARRQAEIEAAKSEEQKAREAEEARIRKEKQDEIDRQRLREAIEKDRERRNREYEPLAQARKDMADDSDAMAILQDTEPRDLREWVSSLLRPHSFLWQDASESEIGLRSELGLPRSDMQRFMTLLGNTESGAKPFGKAVLDIYEGLPEAMKEQYDDQDVRNVVLDLLQSSNNSREMMNLTAENRIAEARETMKENRRREAEWEMEAWCEHYHLTPEERATFEDLMTTEPPYAVEEDIINQIIADNEQNRTSTKLDSPDVPGGNEGELEGGESQVQGTVEAAGDGNHEEGPHEAAEAATGEPPVSGDNVAGEASADRESVAVLLDQVGASAELSERMSDYEVEQMNALIEDWDAVNSEYGEAIEQQKPALQSKNKATRDAAQKIVDEAQAKANEAFEPIEMYIEELNTKYGIESEEPFEGAIPTPKIDNPRYQKIRQDLIDAYASKDKREIKSAVVAIQAYVDEGLDSYGTYSEEVDDYEGDDPTMLADQYMIHVFQDRYLDDDEDQEYIKTGLKASMREQAAPQQPEGMQPVTSFEDMVATIPETVTDPAMQKALRKIVDKMFLHGSSNHRSDPRGFEYIFVYMADGTNKSDRGLLKPWESKGKVEYNDDNPTATWVDEKEQRIYFIKYNPQGSVYSWDFIITGYMSMPKPIGKTSTPEEIQAEEAKVDTNPTDAQKEAGNYQKGHINVDGYDITIENPKGSTRSGVDASGNRWESTMHNTYGYIRGTEGVDGDHIDVFLSDNPTSGKVFVVDQVNPSTGDFDEHKVMYGFASEEEARQAYLSNYAEGWKGLGKITEVSREEFKKWVESSHRKTKPFYNYKRVNTAATEILVKGGTILKNNIAGGDAVVRIVGSNINKKTGEREYLVEYYSDEQAVKERIAIGDATISQEDMRDHLGSDDFTPRNKAAQPKSVPNLTESVPELTESVPETPESVPAAPANPSGNKLVTDERYEQLRERMKKKLLGQFNMGIDPEILAIGTEMAVYHIEKGARAFAEYAKAMIADLGDAIRPYLKAFYNGARDLPEMGELSQGMDDYAAVQGFDVFNFDKQKQPSPVEKAQQVVSQAKADKEAAEAVQKIQEIAKKGSTRKGAKKPQQVQSPSLFDMFEEETKPAETETKPAKQETPAQHKVEKDLSSPEDKEIAMRDALIGIIRDAGIDVITDETEGQRVLDVANQHEVKQMGSTTHNRMTDVATELSGIELTDQQSVIASVFTGEKDNQIVTLDREDGSTVKMKFLQGKDTSAGTKHSLYAHYGTTKGIISANDILRIPDIISKGGRKQKGKNVEYTLKDGKTTFTVYVKIKGGMEIFQDFYSSWKVKNKRESASKPSITQDGENTQGAQSNDANALLGAKVQQNPETTKESDEKLKQFKTPDGHVYGYTYKGKIYIAPSIATSETPIHEYTHLWAEAVRQKEPKTWENIVDVLKNDSAVKPFWDKVTATYPELTDANDIAEEVLAQYSGKQGSERLLDVADDIAKENKGIFGKAQAVEALRRMKNALAKFWNAVADVMGWKYTKAEEVADKVLYDLLRGVNPRNGTKTTLREEKQADLQKVETSVSERPRYQRGESPIDYAARVTDYNSRMSQAEPEKTPVNMARQIYEDAIRDTGERMMIPALLASIGNKENWTRFKHKFAESWFDYSRSIKALQDAIEKATGKAIEGFEDVWRALNSKSSVDNVELQLVMHDLVEPLSEYVGEMIKGKEMDGVPLDMDDVEVYLNAVHGIERNERMAMKQAQDEYEENIALQKQQLESGELADKERKSVEAALLIKKARFYGIKNYMDNETVAKWYNQWQRSLENARTNGTITEEEYQKARAKMETEYEQGQQYKYRDKDYSGLTALFGEDIDGEDKPTEEQLEQAARDYAAKFEDIVGKESADTLWQFVKALNEWSLRKSYESGLISKEQYQDTLSMYQHYVPLRGWHDDYAGDVYQYISRGEPAEVLQGVLKKAYGRKSRAARIFGTMAAMANTAIVQGNKNLVAQRLLNMAMNHRDSGLLMISEQWYQETADGELVPQMPNLRDDMTADEMRQELERFEEDMKARENAGEVQTLRKKFKKEFPLHMAKWQEQRHAVRILRNGKENMVYILGDPRAAEAFNGLLNPNSQPGVVSNIISRYMRFLAKMQTSLSPEFLVSNFQRDVLTASTGAYVKFGKDYQKDFIRNLASVMPLTALVGIKKGKGRENIGGIFSLFRKYDAGKLDDRDETERLFKEFVDFGGMTGISYITKAEEYQASMEEIIKRMRQGKMGKVRNGLDAVSDAVEFANKGIENATRFATYMTSRQRGRSVRDSIFDAKEGSVNFNMKGSGSWGNMLARRMYLYVNPAMQSLRMLGTWYENDPAIATKEGGKMVAKTVGKRFMKAAAATLAASVGTAMLNIMLSQLLHGDGDDDDKKGDGDWWALSEWNRYNFVNVINPFGNGYFHWSIPQELRPLWALGQISVDMVYGRVTWQRGMQSMLLQLNNLSPLSFFEGGTDTDESIISSELRTLTPSYVSTFTDAYGWNCDFMGHKITNQGDWNKNKPEWQRAGKNTPQFMITASRKWNELTGGRRNKKSWADSPYLNPSALYYVFTQQFGGIGSMSKRMFSAFDQWRDPEQEVEMRNMPFVPKFYVATGDDYSKDRVMNDKFWMYYNEFKDADKEMASDRSSVSAGDMTQAEADKTIEQRKADGTYNTWKVIDDNSLDYVFDKVRGTSLEKDVKRMIVDAVEKGTVPDYSKFVKKDGDKAENEVWEKAISRQREHAVANMTDEEVVKAFDATDDQELRKEMAKRISKDAGASKDTYGNADADSKMGTKYEQIRTANDVTEDALLYSYQEKAKKEGNKALADEISKERSKPRNFVRNNYHFGEKYGLDSLSMVYIRRERKKLLEKYGPKESAGSK